MHGIEIAIRVFSKDRMNTNSYRNTSFKCKYQIYKPNQLVGCEGELPFKEDDKAIRILEQVFSGKTIATVDSNEIAKEGGILNCITWKILTNKYDK